MEWSPRDLRFATRTLLRSPGFTTVVVITLALGIGANTAIFSVFNAVLLRPLPYRDPQDLMMFWEAFPGLPIDYVPLNDGGFYDWKERNQAFTDMSGFRIRSHANGKPIILTGEWEPLRINGVASSFNLFATLGVRPLLGRDFREGEDRPGAAKVAVLSHSLWSRLFGSDVNVLGSVIHLDGESHEIVGVLPRGFFFPPPLKFNRRLREGAADVFVPYAFHRDERKIRRIRVLARLKPGLSTSQALASLEPIGTALVEEFPYSNPKGLRPVLLQLREQAVDSSRARLQLLSAAVGAILLIACLNVANLLLARLSLRGRELAVRGALGAGRARIVRLLLVESVLLALLGGLLGIFVASVSLTPLVALSSTYLPNLGPVTIDSRVFSFSFLLTLATGLIVGLIPGLRMSRIDLTQHLKEGGERGGSRGLGRGLLRKGLVTVQVAAATALLVGAGLLVKSLWHLQEVDLGFQTDHVLAIQTWLPAAKYPPGPRMFSFYDRLEDEIESLPEVEQVGAINLLPFASGLFGGAFEIEGRPPVNESKASGQIADYRVVSRSFFDILQIPLFQGRPFQSTDRYESPRVALIDRALADRNWPRGDWEGARVQIRDEWRTVVGVVENIRNKNIRSETEGTIYFPLSQEPRRGMTIVARTTTRPEQLSSQVREAVRRLDPDLPLEIRPLAEDVFTAQSVLRSPALLLVILAVLALVLAVVGLYGVIAYLTGRRTREIGIRVALGATRSRILRLVGAEASILVTTGIALGLLGAHAVSRLISGFLFGVTADDPATYIAVTFLFLLTAAVSIYQPLRGATRVNPVEALRTE